MHYNPSHVREFSCSDFFDLLSGEFGDLEEYGQYFRARDRFRDFVVLDLKKGLITRPIRKLLEAVPFGGIVARRHYQTAKLKHEKTKVAIDSENLDSFYQVAPCEKGETNLRIMVAVCKKIED